jgi:hypothetical protein
LVMLFNYARLNGWISGNPAEGIRKVARPLAHQEELDANVLAPEEAQALLGAAERRATAARIAESERRARNPDAVPQRRLDHASGCYRALIAERLVHTPLRNAFESLRFCLTGSRFGAANAVPCNDSQCRPAA